MKALQQMDWFGKASIFLVLCCFTSSYAKNFTPVISLGTGFAKTSEIGQSQSFPIIDPDTDELYNYSATHTQQTRKIYDVFLGIEWPLNLNWAIQAGFDYAQVGGPYYVKGSFLQGVDLQSSDQYNYSYQINVKELLAETKILYNFKKIYHPYVVLGAGESFNKAQSYSTTVSPFITFTREYEDNLNHRFAYLLGVGMDIDLNSHLRLGLGYRFNDAGKANLGAATINDQGVDGSLKQSHVYISEGLAQLTYVI